MTGGDNIFQELAKVKSEPRPLKISSEGASPLVDESEGQLTVDVYQNENEFIVQSTVAGVNPDDLEIHITNESVTIKGERERSEKIEEKNFLYQECFWGTFSRSIILPAEVDADRGTALVKNGVLTIRLPKLDRKKAKKLKVKAD